MILHGIKSVFKGKRRNMKIEDYIILGIVILWLLYCIALLIRRGRGAHCRSYEQCGIRQQMECRGNDEAFHEMACSSKKCRECMAQALENQKKTEKE